jgi:hypothetical protein
LSPIPLNLVVEDVLSEAILRFVISRAVIPYAVGSCFGRNGNGYLKKNINGFNNAAKGTPFIMLTDLDDEVCAPSLVASWLTRPKHPNFIFRIAKKEVEAWLLADRINFANYLGVSSSLIPLDSESIRDPKELIVKLASDSRYKGIREDLVPTPISKARVGKNYNARLIHFVENNWDLGLASRQADSLSRTVRILQTFRPNLGT